MKFGKKESVFLIQNIFPITEDYIKDIYTIGNVHLVINNEKDIKDIEKKSKKILALIKQGKKILDKQANVLDIYNKLCRK